MARKRPIYPTHEKIQKKNLSTYLNKSLSANFEPQKKYIFNQIA